MLIIAGTIPVAGFPLTVGELSREGDNLVVDGRQVHCTQGTGAMLSAALATTSYLGIEPPVAVLVGDTGQREGSHEIYEYLTDNITKLAPDVLALHYWLPNMKQTWNLFEAVRKCRKKPLLIADAGSMYSAKSAGLASFFDIFTPDSAETAFLADIDAPHPAYVKFMMYNRSGVMPELISQAYREKNAARLMVIKGATDYVAENGEIVTSVSEPDIPAMEAIGGTGDTITGMVAAFCAAGLEPHEAAVISLKANRTAGKIGRVTPATRVKDIVARLPTVFRENLCAWSGVCITGGKEND